ncbi:TRAP dicarboxylate transporter- DctP subunit [Caenispirillum salinarum AK4]|uniref:TRAP dicarboxylate transporter-DctP subunit n=1 Tax=Caenispirillum salinarum AK4 TaxID=1238182 RepID=K9HQN3_9PROT|nr:TRAP transporter substrate-binding protein [Caenispirillum salinarum]EKV32583.1 TRAP dicarboxylate transporter- DctP subunit [Caenispirillum salinarum AK4]
MGQRTVIRTRRRRRWKTAVPRRAAAGLVILALAVLFPPRADARDLVVQSAFPSGMAAFSESERRISEGVESLTGGSLTLRFVGAGGIVEPQHLLEAVREGAVPVGFDWMGYHADRVPLGGLVGSMPFGPTPRELSGWLYAGGGLSLLERGYARLGIVVLPCDMLPSAAGGWFKTEIRSVEDFKGLRIRIAGLGAEVLERLGSESSQEPVAQIYNALEEGRLDAVEFAAPLVDQSFGFHHFTKYYYFPGWHQPASLNILLVNRDVWDSLKEGERAALRKTCRENVLLGLAEGVARQTEAVDAAVARGIEVRRFPDPVLARLRAVSREVVAEAASRDPLAADALASLSEYVEQARRWSALQALPR